MFSHYNSKNQVQAFLEHEFGAKGLWCAEWLAITVRYDSMR